MVTTRLAAGVLSTGGAAWMELAVMVSREPHLTTVSSRGGAAGQVHKGERRRESRAVTSSAATC